MNQPLRTEIELSKKSLKISIKEMNKVKEALFNKDIDTQKLTAATKKMYTKLSTTCNQLVKFSGELWDDSYNKFDAALKDFCVQMEKDSSDSLFDGTEVPQIQKDIRSSILGVSETINTMLSEW